MNSVPAMRKEPGRVDVSGDLATSAQDTALPTDARPGVAGLFDRVLKFNLFPATYAHPDWSKRPPSDFQDSRQPLRLDTPFWIRRSSDALLREWELDRQFDFDFSDPGKRLALLDTQTLQRVGALAAALLARDRLRRIIRGADVANLQRVMGIETYRLAVRWEKALPTADLPAELGRLSAPWPEPDEWISRGIGLVFATLPSSAAGVTGRLRFKFPRDGVSSPVSPWQLSEAGRLGLKRLLIEIIDQEFGEWTWLFAPNVGSAATMEAVT
jgi:YOP proteins translocation protein K (YscK)